MTTSSVIEACRIIVNVWIPMQIAALVGLVLIQVTTALSAGLARGRVWYGFMVSCTLLCIAGCILYVSRQQPTPNGDKLEGTPNKAVCLTQATLMYAGPPLCIAMVVSLFLELYWKVLSTRSVRTMVSLDTRAKSPLLLIVPYGLWSILIVTYLVFGLTNPSKVTFSGFNPYCAFDLVVPRILSCAVSIILSLIVMVLLVMVALLLPGTNNEFRRITRRRHYTALFIRLAAIWLSGLVAVVLSVVFAIQGSQTDIIYPVVGQAGVPLVVVAVFGSQKDILLVWRALARKCLEKLKGVTGIPRRTSLQPKSTTSLPLTSISYDDRVDQSLSLQEYS